MNTDKHLLTIDSPLGATALIWRNEMIVGVQLPAANQRDTLTLCRQRFGTTHQATAPAKVQKAAQLIRAYLHGEVVDFSGVDVDLGEQSDFTRAVLHCTRQITRGVTRSYGEIAVQINQPGAARAVGGALSRNPLPLIIPCHRVVGRRDLGGFTAPTGSVLKLRLLQLENSSICGRVGCEI